jgi:hypothetical protein
MSKKSKPSKPMRRTPLTREQLLPIAPGKARTLSLKSHLALTTLRQGQGNADLASELLKTLYLTFFANEAEKRNGLFETFLAAERALKACIHHAVSMTVSFRAFRAASYIGVAAKGEQSS